MQASSGGAHNLPRQLTSFIGRQDQIAEIRALLPKARLITLTGAGGVGKTRLALAVAEREIDSFPGGVWQVDLARVAEWHLVVRETAAALRLRDQPGQPPIEALIAFVGQRRVLVVLDNCDHLIAPCAALVEVLLRACPEACVLTTSREELAVPGEMIWLVPPLSLDGPAADTARSEAVQLFVERARAVSRTFSLTERNGPCVSDVCRRLDGMPLAIELAASLVHVLSVEQLASRLDRAVAIVKQGSPSTAPRHQTMRGAIAWSVDGLSAAERDLFYRLSVFAGGWTLDAAEALDADSGTDSSVDCTSVLDCLSTLIRKSLVVAEPMVAEDAMRYRMLEPLRQYAAGELHACGNEEASRVQHATFFLAYAERASDGMHRTATQQLWLHRVERDIDNMRAALTWFIDQSDTDHAARLVYALRNLWFYGGRSSEGRIAVDRVMSLPEPWTGLSRVRALLTLGLVSFAQADHATTRRALEDAFELATDIDQPVKAGTALTMLVSTEIIAGNLDRAREWGTTQAEIGRAAGDAYLEGMGMYRLGEIANLERHFDRARPLLEGARAKFAAIDAPHILLTLEQLATISYEQGEYEPARVLAEEALERARVVRGWGPIHSALTLGWVTIGQRDWTRAAEVLSGALRQALELRHTTLVIELLEQFSLVAAGVGQPARALRLNSAALALRNASSTPRRRVINDRLQRGLCDVQRKLSRHKIAHAVAAGQTLSLDAAVADALDLVDTSRRQVAPKGDLSPREQEVAALVARGLSNPQIGEALVISRGTVERHVANILSKLEFRSRSQVAVWAAAHALLIEPASLADAAVAIPRDL